MACDGNASFSVSNEPKDEVMPVAVRLVEVLAIIALVATMAAGAAVVICMEKVLCFVLVIIDPAVKLLNFLLGILQVIFLSIITKLTPLIERLTATLWRTKPKCPC